MKNVSRQQKLLFILGMLYLLVQVSRFAAEKRICNSYL